MTSCDHPDFNLTEQQEAVLEFMADYAREYDGWLIAYDLIGKGGVVNGKLVKIGDAGRRMRELRKLGKLESRKRGRFEEYRLVSRPDPWETMKIEAERKERMRKQSTWNH